MLEFPRGAYETAEEPPRRHKRIYVVHQSRSANRVFQYLAGLSLAQRAPGATLHGYDLDIFGVRDVAGPDDDVGRELLVEAGHNLNLDRLAYLLRSDLCDTIRLKCWAMRMEYLPPPNVVREHLGLTHLGEQTPLLGEDEIAVHVRAGDLFDRNPHRDYPPVPVGFYDQVIAESGLRPVFFGQLDEGRYVSALRDRFPGARFLPLTSAVEDFTRLMLSRNIVCSMSSFCWLASWLSPHAQRIVLPISGLFDPTQRSDVDLLPHADRRYAFYRLRQDAWTGSASQLERLVHETVNAELMTGDGVRQMKLHALETAGLHLGHIIPLPRPPLHRRFLHRLSKWRSRRAQRRSA